MTEKELNREVKKAAEAVRSVRTDVYLIKLWGTYLILGCCGVIVIGLILQMIRASNTAVGMVGVGLIVAAALAILVFYAVQRRRGPLNFVMHEFYMDKNEIIIQVIGKAKYIVSINGTRIGYTKKGEVVEDMPLLAPACLWGYHRDTVFTEHKDKAAGRMYTGTRTNGDKTEKIRLLVRGGTVDYGEVDGMRLRYYDNNQPAAYAVALPDALMAAVKKAGLPLPDGNAVVSVTEKQNREQAAASKKNGK